MILLVELRIRHRGVEFRDCLFQFLDLPGQGLKLELLAVLQPPRPALLGSLAFQLRMGRPLRRLGDLVLLALHEPIVVAAGVLLHQALPLEHQGAGDHVVEEIAVVADDQQGTLVLDQDLFQQLQCLAIQIVRGLVHYQHVGRLGEQPRQQQAVALAAGEAFDRASGPIGSEQEILQVPQDMLLLAVDHNRVAPAADVVLHALLVVQLRVELIEVSDLQAGSMADRALPGP